MMRQAISILALVAIAYGSPVGDRVIGGTNAAEGSIPYQVSLQYEYTGSASGYWHFCGGSLISDTYVMTAAHCWQRLRVVTVYVGSTQKFSGGTRLAINSFIQHPNYDSNKITDDYALIELSTAADFSNPNIGCIGIPPAYEDSTTQYAGDGTISGWGYMYYDGSGGNEDVLPNDLQVASLAIHTNAQCRASFPFNYESASVLCAGGNGVSGGCSGDSGGPFTQGDTLIGVVSYVMGDCLTTYPTGFAKVSSVHDWIYNTIGADKSQPLCS